MQRLYKIFWFDVVAAAVALIIGIIMLPVFHISGRMLYLLLALAIVAYLAIFLVDKLRRTRGITFFISVAEFAVLTIVVTTLVIEQFNPFEFLSVCRILGFVLWARGIVMISMLYFSALSNKKPKPLYARFATSLVLISGGVFLVVNPILGDKVLEWVICISFLVAAIGFAGLAYLFAPSRKRRQSPQKAISDGKK